MNTTVELNSTSTLKLLQTLTMRLQKKKIRYYTEITSTVYACDPVNVLYNEIEKSCQSLHQQGQNSFAARDEIVICICSLL